MAELWDLLDENRKPLGITLERGNHYGCAAYHMVVYIVVKNSKDEYLITLRDPSKHYGGKWEFTCGSSLSGETSLESALRETLEETGIDHTNSKKTYVGTHKSYWDDGELGWHGDFVDVWVFENDFDISKVICQKGETTGAKWASMEEIKKIYDDGMFSSIIKFDELLPMLGVQNG